jgi:aminopeptidase N
MTDEIGALMTLSRLGGQRVESSMTQFFEKWKNQPLVIDKWYSVQSMRHHADGVHAIIRLAETPSYEPNNPNRVRALVGGFAFGNVKLFHKIDGSGYRFFADQVLDMDKRNPSVAARLLGSFEIWRKLDPTRQALVRTELDRIIAAKPSKNVLEIAQRTRA